MKRILSLILALVISLSFAAPSFADGLESPDGSDVEIIAVKPDGSTRAEETCWYYRVHNGMVQMRKWSITYGRWLTDWIDIGPYEGG
jgi:hypothetical protein